MKMTKLLALALSALLLAGSLVSCNNDTPPAEIENSGNIENNEQDTVKAPESGISAYEWKYADDEVMLTINGKDIDFATYRYYAMDMKSEYDKGDENYWNEETEAQFKADMVEQFKTVVAIEKLCDDKGIKLTEADIAGIYEYIEQYKAEHGEEAFNQQFLDLAYRTYQVYIDVYTSGLYLNSLFNTAVKEYASDNYVHVKHVLVSTLDENDQALTGEALEEKTRLANEITERARNGEDFDALVKEYGEDPGMIASPEGYTFTYGKMMKAFEEMSFRLSEGEVSEPVETPYGYHIIQKLPIDFEALISEDNATYQEIFYKIYNSILAEIGAKADSFEAVETDAFKNLTFSNIGIKK